MVKNAPIAGAARKIPKPSEPTFKISCAKMGNKATAPPNNTAIISNESAPKITLFWNTNLTPSFKLCITGSPIFGFIIGFVPIFAKAINAITENPNTILIDQ